MIVLKNSSVSYVQFIFLYIKNVSTDERTGKWKRGSDDKVSTFDRILYCIEINQREVEKNDMTDGII